MSSFLKPIRLLYYSCGNINFFALNGWAKLSMLGRPHRCPYLGLHFHESPDVQGYFSLLLISNFR